MYVRMCKILNNLLSRFPPHFLSVFIGFLSIYYYFGYGPLSAITCASLSKVEKIPAENPYRMHNAVQRDRPTRPLFCPSVPCLFKIAKLFPTWAEIQMFRIHTCELVLHAERWRSQNKRQLPNVFYSMPQWIIPDRIRRWILESTTKIWNLKFSPRYFFFFCCSLNNTHLRLHVFAAHIF